MADRRRESADVDVANPKSSQGVADQGGFEDEGGSRASGGGLGQGGLAAEGARKRPPSERALMTNQRGRSVEDEAAYDEQADVKPGLPSDRPIRAESEEE